MRRIATLLVLLLIAPAAAQFQPDQTPDWGALEHREDIAPAGALDGALRVLRFMQVSDVHIIDDDAPPPVRVDPGDDLFYGTGVSSGASRPQEEFTDELLDALIRAINGVHAEDSLAFVITTGDNIDNQLENELMRFIDNWEGTYTTVGPVTQQECAPDGQSESVEDEGNDVEDTCTHLPEDFSNTPLAPGLPWFSAFGNHDGLIQGNVAPQPSFRELADQFGRYFLTQPEFVGMHFTGGSSCVGGVPAGDVTDDFGHGFAFAGERLCDDDPDNDGYYAFDSRGIRFVVLDTINDDPASASEGGSNADPEGTTGYDVVGGLSDGAIDPVQYEWMLEEIDRHQDKLIVIVSHHPLNSWFDKRADECGPDGCPVGFDQAGYATSDVIEEELSTRTNILAWLSGHTHRHRIEPKAEMGNPFWSIETSSLVDMPQQTRVLELWLSADGSKVFLTATSVDHDLKDVRALAATDAQEKGGAGEAKDQEVLLWFDMPPGVQLTPQATLPRFITVDVQAEDILLGENATVTVHVTENLAGIGVDGLDVNAIARYAADDGGSEIVHNGPLNPMGNGTYTLTFKPVVDRVHAVAVVVSDPTGSYPTVSETVSFDVDVDAPDDDGKNSPLPVLVLVGALLIARRLQNK